MLKVSNIALANPSQFFDSSKNTLFLKFQLSLLDYDLMIFKNILLIASSSLSFSHLYSAKNYSLLLTNSR